ncbi:dihydrolipoyl dehydrogenase [Paenibacillus hemerocallicola]|jgi:dihydrolipoamide dehydrogenase|uniref:Dihydrolipoyl dehydrogenase n=1 Tax=Paenibacillus hemerocallicola TaxID=1172614 RepID=A0A5C4TFC7_9BACL|nr:dihydrolipoyl dehydrogenase [Paenibacillus hemerocallicola]TNJ67356.1 dihydrolipoyl dehydrogenase [Paenibacillus hemerocallicola]
MSKTFDLVVLGGGIGGYSAAIRAAQLGKSVAIVERDKLGGTCLHKGCIPSKALLRSAEVYATMKRADEFGVMANAVSFDLAKAQSRKSAIVEQLHKGLQYLMTKHKIEVIRGNGRIIGPSIFSPRSGSVAVELEDGETDTLVPAQLIIATGSRPAMLPGLEADGKRIMTSDHALEMESLPASIAIIGGGVIGVEWATMLQEFGVEVTIVEAERRLLPTEDEEISRELERLFKKRGIRVMTGAKLLVDSVATEEDGVRMTVETAKGTEALTSETMLVSVGRIANADGIGLENTDVRIEKGVIKVNEFLQTTEPHIYAVGDVNGGLQLAHAAGHEGIAAAEHAAGKPTRKHPDHLVPRCVYTRPEVASVGWTEREAAEQGFELKTAKFSFKPLGKALVLGENDGFVKVVVDAKTNDLLGVHMIGPHATDLISEAALAKLLDATPWEVGSVIHPHPTLSEALGEAMLSVDGLSIGG